MYSPNNIGTNRNIDIVFCIDGTASMTPCIENIKKNALRFYKDFKKMMEANGSDVDALRVKIIVFRDYASPGDLGKAIIESPFFELPADDKDFNDYLKGIHTSGGCGDFANGLEALYTAMKSDFTTGIKDRQLIVMFCDTTAVPLGQRRKYPGYPADMVDEAGLIETWACSQGYETKLREKLKRLIIFAPAGTYYEKVKQQFNRCVFVPVEIHNGLDEVDFTDIHKIMAASASAG